MHEEGSMQATKLDNRGWDSVWPAEQSLRHDRGLLPVDALNRTRMQQCPQWSLLGLLSEAEDFEWYLNWMNWICPKAIQTLQRTVFFSDSSFGFLASKDSWRVWRELCSILYLIYSRFGGVLLAPLAREAGRKFFFALYLGLIAIHSLFLWMNWIKTPDFWFVEFEDLTRFGFIQFKGPEADSTSKSSNISAIGGWKNIIPEIWNLRWSP